MHPDDHTRQTTDIPGFKPFTNKKYRLTAAKNVENEASFDSK